MNGPIGNDQEQGYQTEGCATSRPVPFVYLDNSATTFIHPEVYDYFMSVSRWAANPSSLHRLGIEAERLMTQARTSVASFLGVLPEEIVFTSGGTESNNLAIRGSVSAFSKKGGHLITTKIEHPSVFNTFEDLERQGFKVTYLDVDRHGLVDPAQVLKAVTRDTRLVSIMHVNNEVGAIQPIQEIGKALKNLPEKVLFHVDAVQSFARLPIKPYDMGIDLLSVSGHKIHAPKGVGALFIRKGTVIKPIFTGGGQERGLRSGTENVPAIAAFGKAVQVIGSQMESSLKKMTSLRYRLISGILDRIPNAMVNGPEEKVVPYIVNMSFPGLRGEVLVHYLEDKGVFVSTGSACSSRHPEPSRVLTAMGLNPKDAEGSIRISLSPLTEESEIDVAVSAIVEAINELQSLGFGRARRG